MESIKRYKPSLEKISEQLQIKRYSDIFRSENLRNMIKNPFKFGPYKMPSLLYSAIGMACVGNADWEING